MRSSKCLGLLAGCCWLIFGVGGRSARAADGERSGLEVALRLERERVSRHQPVVAVLHLKNSSPGVLEVDLGLDFKGNLLFNFTQPDGRQVTRRLPEAFDGFGEIGRVSLQPAETFDKQLVLNEWYAFDQEGAYRVDVAIAPEREPAAARVQVAAASTQLRVTARDPESLAAACKRLAEKALREKPEPAHEAAFALSFATDEVCLDSLSRVLRANYSWSRSEAIKGLARLGSGDAVGAVVRAWGELEKSDQQEALLEFTFAGAGKALREALQRSGKKVEQR